MKKFFSLCAVLLVAVAAMAQNGTKYYGIKSGTIKVEMDMMGQTIPSTIYFDDFGAKQATSINMMGMEMTQINKDGKMYLVNKGEKSVQEMPQQQEQINYLNLTDEVKAKYKIKEVGKETVAGKECTTYTVEVSQMGQTVKTTVSVWNGIAMKTVADAGGFSMSQKVTEVKEAPVDAAIFEIPKF
ncbi:MAG: DUF4412 domain-containing protein [Bacteroidales bacterium]|nr:DUF4412 domain-containing protein [Bacteroidales bacterium]